MLPLRLGLRLTPDTPPSGIPFVKTPCLSRLWLSSRILAASILDREDERRAEDRFGCARRNASSSYAAPKQLGQRCRGLSAAGVSTRKDRGRPTCVGRGGRERQRRGRGHRARGCCSLFECLRWLVSTLEACPRCRAAGTTRALCLATTTSRAPCLALLALRFCLYTLADWLAPSAS